MLAFEFDSRELAVLRGQAVDLALLRALRSAGNKALKQLNASSVEYVVGRKTLARDDVEQGGFVLEEARRTRDIDQLEWKELVSGKPKALTKFAFIATKGSGVSAQVNVASGMKNLPHAFAARLSNGHLGIFMRKGKSRLPIHQLLSTRISDAMSDRGAVDKLSGAAMGVFQKAFTREFERQLRTLKKKGDL